MKKHLIAVSALCASCLMAAAQAQTDPSKPGGTSSQDDPSSATKSYKDKDKDPSTGTLSPTGRSGQQVFRASKLMNAQVKGSSGSPIGTINDILFNPAAGKVDFAVISLSSSSSDTSTSSTSSSRTPATTPGGTPGSSSQGKLVAVPWNMLRPSPSAGYSATSTTSSGGEVALVFAGDQSKLQSAPAFDESTDISQPSWRQSIYSHFGVSAGSSTGGATSPGGTGTSTSDSSQPDSSSTTPPRATPPKSTSPTTPDSTGSSSKP